MKLLTKAEACRDLGVSLSTLNRRIAAGKVAVTREPRGRRHRVYVVLDDEPPVNNDNNEDSGNTALAAARERIRDLETQVEILREQFQQERRRNADLGAELRAAQARRSPRWWFWLWGSDNRALTGKAGDGMMDSKTTQYGQ